MLSLPISPPFAPFFPPSSSLALIVYIYQLKILNFPILKKKNSNSAVWKRL